MNDSDSPQTPQPQTPPAADHGPWAAPPVMPSASASTPAPAPGWAPPPAWGGHPVPPSYAAPGAPSMTTPRYTPPAPGAPAASPPRRGGGILLASILAATLVGGAAGIGGGYLGASLAQPVTPDTIAGPGAVTVNNPGSVNETTAIAAKVLPSVVTIDVAGTTSAGSGSGVILSADGYIVTNAHVVTLDGAVSNATVRVMTSDGRLMDAEIVGIDPVYDLAVIKVEARGLTPIEFTDSSALNVGDTAVAVGAPLGYANSVTTGIVSALNRSISIASSALPDSGNQGTPDDDDDSFEFRLPGQQEERSASAQRISIAVIQTDAAINPGNSGGALVDSAGRLIGINVAIATTTGRSSSGSIGLGFAIPSNIAQRVVAELIEFGTASHGMLGAMVQSSTGVEGTRVAGAYIGQIITGGAAEAAGLAEGDIVTMFNGVPITSANDLTAQVRAVAAGSVVSLRYVRGDVSRTIEVTLGTLVL